MRSLISSLLILIGAPSFALDVCQSFLVCGTYKATWTSGTKKAVSTIVFSGVAANVARFQYTTEIKGQPTTGLDLTVQFENDGTFKMIAVDKTSSWNYASGICSNLICTYGIHPWIPSGSTQAIGNVGMLRFNASKLEYVSVYGTPLKNTKAPLTFSKQ